MPTPEQLPKGFLSSLAPVLADGAEAFAAALAQPPRAALRTNPLRVGAPLPACARSPVPGCPGGWYADPAARHMGAPLHEGGGYYVQEPSAMLTAGLLPVEPGMSVLDLCAAPGGKAWQLGAACAGGLFVANEPVPQRARILCENLERMGLGRALITCEEPARLARAFGAAFDRILVDAPCSGEGMFRKNPETMAEWSPANVARCHARQMDILRSAAQLLRPGGLLLYSTCTFNRSENEGTAEAFLAEHGDFSLVLTRRMWPQEGVGEGHFAALFRKAGECAPRQAQQYAAIPEALADVLATPVEGRVERFAGFACAVHPLAPKLDGLKVIRPGLQLWQEERGRIVPAHALAMALRAQDALRCARLDAAQARRFIAGEAIDGDFAPGLTLAVYEGLPLGWGKAVPGRLQNYRPKGLRRA